jgi:hypothetical protein
MPARPARWPEPGLRVAAAVAVFRLLICQFPPGQGRGSPGMPRPQLPGPQLLSAELLVRGSTGPPSAKEDRTS